MKVERQEHRVFMLVIHVQDHKDTALRDLSNWEEKRNSKSKEGMAECCTGCL